MSRQINAAGLTLIKSFEELRLIGYMPTPNDKPTAGWGHTGPDVVVGETYTEDQAEAWIVGDVARAEAAVDAVCPSLSDNEFAACVSLAFNIGVGAFETSTLARYLKLGQKGAAATQFLVWDHQAGKVLPGLQRRRSAERALFLTPDPTPDA